MKPEDITTDIYTAKTNWYLYVLQCENELFYIGTTMFPYQRIDNHFEGFGANFTKKNKPLNIVDLYSLDTFDRKEAYKYECEKTKEYRNIFGCDKVVGGKYLQLKKTVNKKNPILT